mgnify:FL=1|jgi:hypothetical protein
MKRDYASGEKEDVTFFVGDEIEHTPAFGKRTLFVVGLQECSLIAENLLGCEHIFFGANHSFNPTSTLEWEYWVETIKHFLNKGYLCSLDIPIALAEAFVETSLVEFNNFIPQLRVPIPYIKLWNYNTMLKIDDKGFNQSNPGVWSHSIHDLMDRTKFTDWEAYKGDVAK